MTAKTSATNATWNRAATMRESPGRCERAAYNPERANNSAVSRYANGTKCRVSSYTRVALRLPSTTSLSTSAVYIASATPMKSSASNDTTRPARRAVSMRSSSDIAGGRLLRMSRSECSLRAVVSDITVCPAGTGELAAGGCGRTYLGGRLCADPDGLRGVGGADVPEERGPISLLTTPQT